jgi:hypothetical protein
MASGVKLSHFADIVQVGGWKHYQYIRCPELLWGIHETNILDRPRLIDFNDLHVQSVLGLLRKPNGAVFDLIDHEEVTPLHVVSALWHINTKLRGAIHNDRPPRFSYLCIRVTPEQTASQFWEVFWRAIGAPFSAFEQFAHASSSAQAALLLAQVLNTFQPLSPSFSYRAPDIIVIIGADHFQSISEHLIPEPLSVPDILDHIKSLTLLSTAPTVGGLERFLRHTRIILIRDLPDAGSEGRDIDESEIDFKRLDKQEYPVLCALSTFRWGFSHTMASLMLFNNQLGRFPGTGNTIRSFRREWRRETACRGSSR